MQTFTYNRMEVASIRSEEVYLLYEMMKTRNCFPRNVFLSEFCWKHVKFDNNEVILIAIRDPITKKDP